MTNSTTLVVTCSMLYVVHRFLMVRVMIPSPFRGCGFQFFFPGSGNILPTSLTDFHSVEMELPDVETWRGSVYNQEVHIIFRLLEKQLEAHWTPRLHAALFWLLKNESRPLVVFHETLLDIGILRPTLNMMLLPPGYAQRITLSVSSNIFGFLSFSTRVKT